MQLENTGASDIPINILFSTLDAAKAAIVICSCAFFIAGDGVVCFIAKLSNNDTAINQCKGKNNL